MRRQTVGYTAACKWTQAQAHTYTHTEQNRVQVLRINTQTVLDLSQKALLTCLSTNILWMTSIHPAIIYTRLFLCSQRDMEKRCQSWKVKGRPSTQRQGPAAASEDRSMLLSQRSLQWKNMAQQSGAVLDISLSVQRSSSECVQNWQHEGEENKMWEFKNMNNRRITNRKNMNKKTLQKCSFSMCVCIEV